MDHFERIELNDLTNSIILHRKTLTLCPSDHSDRHVSLDNLANSLWIRFERLGQLEDLEEAITLCRETVSLSSLGHPDHSSLLTKLADRVLNRYEQLGLAEDLEEAIALHSEALALNSLGHPHRSRSLTNLANCIRTRFYQLGRPEDLEDAIAFNREALSLRPSGHPDRSVTLSSLGNSIIARFEYLHQPQDFEEGISLHREALALCPSGHPNRFVALKDLANGLLSCCNDLENLEEMIMLRREALSLCPPGRPGHIDCLRLLAKSVIIRGQHLSRAEDLEEAVSYGLRAVENARVTGHPLLTDILGDLGNAYILLKDFDRGFQFFEDAINHIHSSSVDRFKTALAWSTIARRHHHPSTLKAYVSALELSERHLAVLPSVQLQSMFLAEDVRRLPSDAASYAIQEGHLETAVEMLEQGRAQLWSKMRGYRHTLGNLRETNPELAARFERVSFELESLATSVIIVETSQAAEASEVSRRLSRQRDLSDQWNSILRDIREVPGRSAFFTTPPYSDLRIAAAEGPVIMVNVTAHRSDALIIRANDTPTLVPLDENLSPTTIFILSSRLSNINSNRKMVLGGKSRHRTDAADKMPSILQTLWRDICGPVAAKLKGMGIPANSRIWWCPTGDLCHLPLHAAGPHSTNEKNFSDLFVSSYTPTLSSLINARHTMQSEPGSKPRLLAIGQSQFLPQVKTELDHIKRIFSDHVRVLDGSSANPDTVLAGLRDHPWVHFACHGSLEDALPFKACFTLHGGNVSLLQIMKARLPNAEIAFLAACHSAAGEPIGNPNEALNLAAAMQFCGYRTIVGTMWAMSDKDGPELSRDFYEYMLRQGLENVDIRDSATSLHLAVDAMKKRGVPMSRWSTFIHVGV